MNLNLEEKKVLRKFIDWKVILLYNYIETRDEILENYYLVSR